MCLSQTPPYISRELLSVIFLLVARVGLTLILGQYSLLLSAITDFVVIGTLIGNLLLLKGTDRVLEETSCPL